MTIIATTTMKQYYLTAFLFCLLATLSIVDVDAKRKTSATSSRLRGNSFDALEERARNPVIKEDVRGKTLKDLGVVLDDEEESNEEENQQGRRNIQQQQQQQNTETTVSMKYFSVYDEFGPFFVSMGDTAGVRGMIYNPNARDNGLTEEFVEGALQGTCSVVASDGKQLCNYEIFLFNPASGSMGTIVATGSVLMELNNKNILIVEATGDDFVQYGGGGMVAITYTAIGGQTVMDIDVTLRR